MSEWPHLLYKCVGLVDDKLRHLGGQRRQPLGDEADEDPVLVVEPASAYAAWLALGSEPDRAGVGRVAIYAESDMWPKTVRR